MEETLLEIEKQVEANDGFESFDTWGDKQRTALFYFLME